MTLPEAETPTNAIVRAFEVGDLNAALAMFGAAGGDLYALYHGYDDLGRVLSAMPDGLWRSNELLMGAYTLHLAKHGRAGRAQAHLTDPACSFDKTYRFDIYELRLAIHLGDPISKAQLDKWIATERQLPLNEPLQEGLYYNAIMVFLVRHGRLQEARTMGQRAIAAYQSARHIYLEHFIHLHLADLAIMEGRLRDARRHLHTGAKRLAQSDRTYGNEQEIIEILQLALDFETGNFDHIPAQAKRLRHSLVKSDSWVEVFEQLARIAVKSTYFTAGRDAALAVLDDFRAGYAERHGGASEVLTVLEATIGRLDGRLGDVELATTALDFDRLQSPIARVLLSEIGMLPNPAADETRGLSGPRNAIVTALQSAARETGNQRRRLVEQAFWLAAKESHSAPFIEHRDVLSGIGTRLSSGRFARGNVQLARMARHVVQAIRHSYWVPPELRALGVTHRQYNIVSALQSGATNKEIARTLAVSEATVKYHLSGLYQRIGASRRGELLEIIYEK